jgi:hypothetical protein
MGKCYLKCNLRMRIWRVARLCTGGAAGRSASVSYPTAPPHTHCTVAGFSEKNPQTASARVRDNQGPLGEHGGRVGSVSERNNARRVERRNSGENTEEAQTCDTVTI